MKGCPVAFFSFAFCVKQIAFKLTPQLTQLTGALSVSDREPRGTSGPSTKQPSVPPRAGLGQADCPAGAGCMRVSCHWTAGTDRQAAAQRAAAEHRAAAHPASAACCRAALLGTGERPKHNH